MAEMQSFSLWLLGAIADFLSTEPVFYVFGLICFVFIVKVVMTIIYPKSK